MSKAKRLREMQEEINGLKAENERLTEENRNLRRQPTTIGDMIKE